MDASLSLPTAQFIATKVALIAEIVAALLATRVHEYYPDDDLVIRIRKGNILPDVEIQARVKQN